MTGLKHLLLRAPLAEDVPLALIRHARRAGRNRTRAEQDGSGCSA